MQNQPEICFQANRDSLAQAAKLHDFLAFDAGDRRYRGAQQEWSDDLNALERLAQDSLLKGFNVNGDVGELGHEDYSMGQLDSRGALGFLWAEFEGSSAAVGAANLPALTGTPIQSCA